MKFYERWLQALLSLAPRGFAARSRVLARLASLAPKGELTRRLITLSQEEQFELWAQHNFTYISVIKNII